MAFLTPEEQKNLDINLGKIKHKIMVLSGKGGVGKSSVAVNLAFYLSLQGKKVGLMDVDFHGPSIPRMIGKENEHVFTNKGGSKVYPMEINENFHAMSVGFMLNSVDNAVIWRGPLKFSAIKQFLIDVEWGELDYLIIDAPPGTGDEPLTVAQFLGKNLEAIVVTTPQDVAISDVRKSLSFCQQLKMNLLGLVVNMNGFTCPHCGTVTKIFQEGHIKEMAEQFKVPIIGDIPMEPEVSRSGDKGEFFMHSYGKKPAGEAFEKLGMTIVEITEKIEEEQPQQKMEEKKNTSPDLSKIIKKL